MISISPMVLGVTCWVLGFCIGGIAFLGYSIYLYSRKKGP